MEYTDYNGNIKSIDLDAFKEKAFKKLEGLVCLQWVGRWGEKETLEKILTTVPPRDLENDSVLLTRGAWIMVGMNGSVWMHPRKEENADEKNSSS